MSLPDLAALVARLLTPLAGAMFFGWSAPAMLLLYFADTLASVAVICAGLLGAFYPPENGESLAARVNAHVGVVAGGLFIAAMFAVPLGMPLLFILGPDTLLDALAEPSLRTGLLAQAVFALWSYAGLYHALQAATPEQLGLKRRFALAFLRWIVMVVVGTSGIGLLLGQYAALAFVALYTLVSFYVEVAPNRFLRMFGPQAADVLDTAAPGPADPAPRPGRGVVIGRRPKRRDRR